MAQEDLTAMAYLTLGEPWLSPVLHADLARRRFSAVLGSCPAGPTQDELISAVPLVESATRRSYEAARAGYSLHMAAADADSEVTLGDLVVEHFEALVGAVGALQAIAAAAAAASASVSIPMSTPEKLAEALAAMRTAVTILESPTVLEAAGDHGGDEPDFSLDMPNPSAGMAI